jgi:PAS domain S-box-containing protein
MLFLTGHINPSSPLQPEVALSAKLRTHRILLAMGIILIPIFGLLMKVLDPSAYDPFSGRLLFAAFFGLLLTATYWQRVGPRYVSVSQIIARFGFTAYLLMVLSGNTDSALYVTLLLGINAIVAFTNTSRWHLIGYQVFSIGGIFLAFQESPAPIITPITAATMTFCLHTLIFLVQNRQLKLRETLAASETFLRSVFEQSGSGLMVLDINSGNHTQVNRSFKTMYGAFTPEALASTARRIFSIYQQELTDVQKIRESGRITSEDVVSLTEGSKHFTLNFNPMHLAEGPVVMVTVNDASHRHKIQAELTQQRNQAQMFLDIAGAAIMMLDPQGCVIMANPACCELTGYGQGDLLGNDWFTTMIASDELPAVRSQFMKAMSTGRFQKGYENKIITKDGETRWVNWRGAVITDSSGKITGSLHSGLDITNSRSGEEALQLAKRQAEALASAKADFLATMSHEIRTPMNGVIGMTGLLLDTPLNVEQRDYAETIRTCGDALLTIVNDILDLSKLAAGKVRVLKKPMAIEPLVEEVFDMLAPAAKHKQIDLLYHVESGVPEQMLGDAARTRQVLLNLVSNALKFTQEGEVVLRISAVETENSDQKTLRVSVRDSGIGIPKDRQILLFEPFEQVEFAHGAHGTGLGLAISQRLASLLGGEVKLVWSKPGVGSEFALTLPLEAHEEAFSPTLTLVPEAMMGKRVLVVDDNVTNRTILTLQLQKWGMTPVAVACAAQALQLIGTQRFDIGLLDRQMPFLDGITLAKTLRNMPTAKSMPMVLLSSAGTDGPLEPPAGLFSTALSKPVKNAVLLKAIADAMDITSLNAPKGLPISRRAPFQKMALAADAKVLIADDNAINRKLMRRLLEALGFQPDEVDTGRRAVEAVVNEAYHIVFMDMQMPEMDGLEATRAITGALSPDRRPVLIAMTASVLDEDKERCMEAGLDDYLPKPIVPAELQAILSRWSYFVDKRLKTIQRLESKSDLLDDTVVGELRQLNDAAFSDHLVELYAQQIARFVPAIRRDIENQNFTGLRQAAHSLKGASFNLGAARLGKICQQIEFSCIPERRSALPGLVDELEALGDPTLDALGLTLGLEQAVTVQPVNPN